MYIYSYRVDAGAVHGFQIRSLEHGRHGVELKHRPVLGGHARVNLQTGGEGKWEISLEGALCA